MRSILYRSGACIGESWACGLPATWARGLPVCHIKYDLVSAPRFLNPGLMSQELHVC